MFCKVVESEARSVLETIDLYKYASRKAVNDNKSKVFFSKGVQAIVISRICTMLGMKEVQKFQKYLGLPALRGSRKKSSLRI